MLAKIPPVTNTTKPIVNRIFEFAFTWDGSPQQV